MGLAGATRRFRITVSRNSTAVQMALVRIDAVFLLHVSFEDTLALEPTNKL